MTERRPLVRIDGETVQLPTGDTLPTAGTRFPFYLQTGASPIPLTGAGALPFFLASGASSDIPVIA